MMSRIIHGSGLFLSFDELIVGFSSLLYVGLGDPQKPIVISSIFIPLSYVMS